MSRMLETKQTDTVKRNTNFK